MRFSWSRTARVLKECNLLCRCRSMVECDICFFIPFLFFQYELQRISFDEAVSSIKRSKDTPTADVIRNVLRMLLFFYSDSKDTQRLVKKLMHVTQFVTINIMNCYRSGHIQPAWKLNQSLGALTIPIQYQSDK